MESPLPTLENEPVKTTADTTVMRIGVYLYETRGELVEVALPSGSSAGGSSSSGAEGKYTSSRGSDGPTIVDLLEAIRNHEDLVVAVGGGGADGSLGGRRNGPAGTAEGRGRQQASGEKGADGGGGGAFADDLSLVLCRVVRRLWIHRRRRGEHEEGACDDDEGSVVFVSPLEEIDLSHIYPSSKPPPPQSVKVSSEGASPSSSAPPPTCDNPHDISLSSLGIGDGSRVYVAWSDALGTLEDISALSSSSPSLSPSSSAAASPAVTVASLVGALITDMGCVETMLRRQLADALREGKAAVEKAKKDGALAQKRAMERLRQEKDAAIDDLNQSLNTLRTANFKESMDRRDLQHKLEKVSRSKGGVEGRLAHAQRQTEAVRRELDEVSRASSHRRGRSNSSRRPPHPPNSSHNNNGSNRNNAGNGRGRLHQALLMLAQHHQSHQNGEGDGCGQCGDTPVGKSGLCDACYYQGRSARDDRSVATSATAASRRHETTCPKCFLWGKVGPSGLCNKCYFNGKRRR